MLYWNYTKRNCADNTPGATKSLGQVAKNLLKVRELLTFVLEQ